MSIPSGKKILLIGFIIVLLVAIPITIYFVSQQQKAKTTAVPSTSLSFVPSTQSVNVGESVSFDINMNPGANQVSFVKILISYDATKLATDGAGFAVNTTSFPSVLQQPTYEAGTILVTLSTGSNPQNAIQKPTKIGTLTFKALVSTDAAPTQITFGNQTQVLSAGSKDQFNENLLSSTSPATLTIAALATQTPTPTTIALITPTPLLTTAVATASPTPTPIVQSTSSGNLATSATGPVCSSLVLDRSAIGIVPYNVNLTVTGSSANSTISKVTFNFGDGQIQNVTQSGGVGTNSISVLQSHIYNQVGAFTATATLTDANGAVSLIGPCSVSLVINPAATPTAIASKTAPLPSPLPPTGPNSLVAIGTIGVILAIIGAALLFAL